MTVTELLASIRNRYAERLTAAIANVPGAHVEPAYRIAGGALAVEGDPALPYRADLIPTQGAQAGVSLMVDSETKLQFEPLTFPISLATVHLAPFTWEWVRLKVAGLSLVQTSTVMSQWFLRWFDGEDTNPPTAEGLYGVVHFLSNPEVSGVSVTYNLDLGSSSEAALEDLLFCLTDVGASDINVG